MSSKAAKKDSGATKPTQFRLAADVLADLDLIQKHYGQASRTDAVRLAAKREADRIRKEAKK